MPFQIDNILKFNQYMKSNKMSCIIYADLESLIKKSRRTHRQLRKNLQQQK